jgi:hypothetical protein
MRRVEDKSEFEKIVLEVRTCVHIDSRRIKTSLQLLVFDDAVLCSEFLFPALQSLMEWSADPGVYFVVLHPDPVDNFHRLYGKFPMLEISRDDSFKAYLEQMNEDLGDGRGFSLCDLSSTWVIVPPSSKWFIHAIRTSYDDSGHLWVPSGWVDRLLAAHPGIFFRDEPASLIPILRQT